MIVQLRSFANIREAFGAKNMSVELPNGATLKYLLTLLENKYPMLQTALTAGSYILVVNDAYITSDKFNSIILKNNDSIVILPPSGGG